MLGLKTTAIVAAVLVSLLAVQTARISALKLDAQEALTDAVQAERARALELSKEKDRLAQANRDLSTQIESLEKEANAKQTALAAAVRAADDQRVQHKADLARVTGDLQERARRAVTDAEREASAAAIGVLADVYSRADELAGIYAAEADHTRLAGSTCEAQYAAVRQRHQAWLAGAEPGQP